MSAATVPQVLRDAAELIERDGWCQGQFVDDAGCHCAVGSILAATGWDSTEGGDWGSPPEDPVITFNALDIVAEHVERNSGSLDLDLVSDDVVCWNDAPHRTVTEVLAALRGAADAWEAEHG